MAIGCENRIVYCHVAADLIGAIDHCRDRTTSIRTLGKNTDNRGFSIAPLYYSLWYRSGDLRAVGIVFSKKPGMLYLNKEYHLPEFSSVSVSVTHIQNNPVNGLSKENFRIEKGLDIQFNSMYYVSHSEVCDMVRINKSSTLNLDTELRRGALVLAVLSQMRTAQYGYSLRQALAEQGMPIEEGTLYPLLRRLEEQGLLASDWRIEDGNPPRRYYELNSKGTRLLADLTVHWQALVVTMNRLLK
jgi:PadR family transcriptional regulator PadR